MNFNPVLTRHCAVVALSALILPFQTASAEETDFSCVIENVRDKTMVTQRYREFDVILENDCPGAVNWAMCIERMDPFTHRVTETLTPSGAIAKDDKFRINLQMKRQEDRQTGLAGYEEFYVDVVYAIDSVPGPSCVARECESEKRSVREKIRSTQRARDKAQEATDRKMAAECPKSGWSDSQQEKCMSRIQKDSKPELDALDQNIRALKLELAEISPEKCTTYPQQ